MLAHKLLQSLEKEIDNKRLIRNTLQYLPQNFTINFLLTIFVTQKRAITELIPHFYINIILSIADVPSDETVQTITGESAEFKSLEIAYISKWNQVANILNGTDIQNFTAKRKIFSEKVFSEDDGNCETERYRFIHALLVKQGILDSVFPTFYRYYFQ